MCTVSDHPDCLVSQTNYCCSADDDCSDAFEYQRFEDKQCALDPLADTVNLPQGSECQLPRAAAAAQRAENPWCQRAAGAWPPGTQGFKEIRAKYDQHFVGKPASVVLARSREDEVDKENLPVNTVVRPQQSMRTVEANLEPTAETGEIVTVHLYDLSEALAQINSVSIDLIGYGGALHVGVEVFGIEWSFGTGGVSCSVPKQNRHYVYRQSVRMGRTAFTQKEVHQAVLALQKEWPGSDYDLFLKNCGTFCNSLCMRLGVGDLPAWVTRLAEDGGRSATVRRIADMMAQNGLIGEASPLSQISKSQPSQSRSPQCGSQATSCSDLETPRHDELELDGWISRLSCDDWLEEELADKFHSPSLAKCEQSPSATRYSRRSSGLTRSTSEQVELPSPVRGSRAASRCSTFRANSYPQMKADLSDELSDDGYAKEKAFCMKRLALGPRPAYGANPANLAEAVHAFSMQARNGGC